MKRSAGNYVFEDGRWRRATPFEMFEGIVRRVYTSEVIARLVWGDSLRNPNAREGREEIAWPTTRR